MRRFLERTSSWLTGRWRAESYDNARAEMGGAPWREVPKSTDQWFILDSEVAPSFDHKRPLRRWAMQIGVGLVVTLALLLVVARASAPSPGALPPAMVQPIAAAPALPTASAPSLPPVAVAVAAEARPVKVVKKVRSKNHVHAERPKHPVASPRR